MTPSPEITTPDAEALISIALGLWKSRLRLADAQNELPENPDLVSVIDFELQVIERADESWAKATATLPQHVRDHIMLTAQRLACEEASLRKTGISVEP